MSTKPEPEATESQAVGRHGVRGYGSALLSRLLGPGSARISALAQAVRRTGLGEDVFVPVAGNDEIADLTIAFNDMVSKLRENRQRLEEARDQLAQTNEGMRAANRTLETLVVLDVLTGLYNNRHFQDTIDREIRRCDREHGVLSLLLIDLDHFKQYNERFGHSEGDSALRRVGSQIAAQIRPADVAFRCGGEEMAVLLPACGKEQATEVAEKIRTAVSTSTAPSGRVEARNTVSIGVATYPEDAPDDNGLVETARAAAGIAFRAGGDRVGVAGRAETQ
jgi:diguanylate cyclase (GGDEF)-like protein